MEQLRASHRLCVTLADSVDFLEDASVNDLAALGPTARNRARLGLALTGILLIPGSFVVAKRGSSSNASVLAAGIASYGGHPRETARSALLAGSSPPV